MHFTNSYLLPNGVYVFARTTKHKEWTWGECGWSMVLYLIPDDPLGISPFARLAEPSDKLSEISAKCNRWQFAVLHIPHYSSSCHEEHPICWRNPTRSSCRYAYCTIWVCSFSPSLMLINANSSSGFKDQESYKCFEAEYNAFIKKCQTEGCSSSAAHVTSCLPFQLGTMISSVYLLVTRWLSTKSFYCRTVINVAAMLGPHKLHCLLVVEDIIWDAIFHLTEGCISVYTVLWDLANSLPWSDIDMAFNCDADRWWFTTGSHMFLCLLVNVWPFT